MKIQNAIGKLLFALLLSLLIAIPISSAESKKLPWYSITDWEVDVCSKWGGDGTTEQKTTVDKEIPFGDMVRYPLTVVKKTSLGSPTNQVFTWN